MKDIIIKGAREHNLKNIDLTLPRDQFIVITGLSGSGKSTLAFDTIYAEGQRRYVESLSAYARQFLGLMNKPDVDTIDGLSPAISIEQKTTSKNPRSTVGTITEIYDYLRLLFARIGTPYCPIHDKKIVSRTPENIADTIASEYHSIVTLLSPIIRQKKGTYEQLFKDLNKQGYLRVRVDKAIYRTDETISLDRYKKHDIELVIDRVDPNETSRLTEACEQALAQSDGLLIVLDEKGQEQLFSSKLACPTCGLAFEELQPRLFSFNSPFGACETCHGLGINMEFDPELIIPDKDTSIADGAIKLYKGVHDRWRIKYLGAVAHHFGFDIFTQINHLTEQQYNVLMYGSDENISFNLSMNQGQSQWSGQKKWEGLIPQSARLYRETASEYRRRDLERFMRVYPCPTCNGKRLTPKALSVKIDEQSIADITDKSIKDVMKFFKTIVLTQKQQEISWQILKEINARLLFLDRVGLNYLTLSRNAGTLSGGEAQRIRLATQIGSNLMGVIYILDEPSIGLHHRDNKKLIDTLHHLRDMGNTLIVVEHDEETIRNADYIVDMGPGAGIHGGFIVAQGTPEEISKHPTSLTGKYLTGELCIPIPEKRRKTTGFLHIYGCREHNLKNIDVDIPLGVLTLITGVSGSGKSTLIYDILYKGLRNKIHHAREIPGEHDRIRLDRTIDKIVVIDQSPIGKTPRSNPATYTQIFDEIRGLFAQTQEAKARGYKPGRFSFNVKGGRCEACQGDGVIKIEMNFLPDVYIECEECKGKRYNQETLDVTYKGKTIADILSTTVEEAGNFFENIPSIKRKLETLSQVGLEYITLGQSSTTLSGGEAQRIKLTRELAKKSTGNTLYLLDEPTTGLHFHDVKKLIDVLNNLVDKGNSILVIEHNLEVIKNADYIIDMGPEGGDRGGRIIATGTPEEIAANPASYTGNVLEPLMKRKKELCSL
ncbi:MAG: excinuclease ABC subunit UvrA [Thermoplasmatota archaeon]